MDWIIAIVIGGLTGWAASSLMRGRRQNILTDILVGIVGAALARWFFGSILGIGSAFAAGTLTLLGIVWGIIGAVVLIAIVRAIMPGERSGQMGPSYHEEIRDKRKHHNDEDL